MARGLLLTQPFPLDVQLYVILHNNNNNSGLRVVSPVIQLVIQFFFQQLGIITGIINISLLKVISPANYNFNGLLCR